MLTVEYAKYVVVNGRVEDGLQVWVIVHPFPNLETRQVPGGVGNV